MYKRLLLLLFIAVFALKFYKAGDLFYFAADEDILGLTVKRILIDNQLQFVGLAVPGGIFIGPAFYYLGSLVFLAGGMNPGALPYFASILGILTIYLVYKVGKVIFEKEAIGILAAVIYGFSYLANVYNKVLTGLTLGPILALFTYLILYRNIGHREPKNLLFLAVLLALAVQNEGSSFSLALLVAVVWLVYRFAIPGVKFLQMILILVVFHLPLLIYDAFNNFFYTKSSLLFFLNRPSILKSDQALPFNFSTIFNSFEFFGQTFSRFLVPHGPFDISKQLVSCPDVVSVRLWTSQSPFFWLGVLILGFFLAGVGFSKKRAGEMIILLHLLTLFAGLLGFNFFVRGYFHEWTLALFFPGLALISASFLYFLWQKNVLVKVLVSLALAAFVYINVRAIILSDNSYGLSRRVAAVKYVLSETGGAPFYLESLGSCYSQGYLYLFWYFGHLPSKFNGIGAYFVPNLIDRGKEQKVDLAVILADSTIGNDEKIWRRYQFYKSVSLESRKFGDIEVLILPYEEKMVAN